MRLERGYRITVVSGPHAGQHGTLIRSLRRGEWLVKLDGRMSGTTVKVRNMEPERLT